MGRETTMHCTQPVGPLVCWLTYIASVAWIGYRFARPGGFPDWGLPTAADGETPSSWWWVGFTAHCESTFVIWIFSLVSSNTSLYDPAWCILPIALGVAWMAAAAAAAAGDQAPSWRGAYSLALLCVWYLRYQLWFPWDGWFHGITTEDWRYIDLANKLPGGGGTPLYWLLSLLSLHLTPTLLVWFAVAPVGATVWTAPDGGAGAPELHAGDAVAAAVALGAIVIQAVSDEQLRRFRTKAYAAERGGGGEPVNLMTATSSKKVSKQ